MALAISVAGPALRVSNGIGPLRTFTCTPIAVSSLNNWIISVCDRPSRSSSDRTRT